MDYDKIQEILLRRALNFLENNSRKYIEVVIEINSPDEADNNIDIVIEGTQQNDDTDEFEDDDVENELWYDEVIEMLDIGEAIYEDGVEDGLVKGLVKGIAKGFAEGRTKGKVLGKADIVTKLLLKKFKALPSGYIDKINELSEASLEILASDIFEIEKLQDIERYFTDPKV